MSFGGCLSVTMPCLLKYYLCVSFCLELIVSVRCHELQGIRVQMVWCLFMKMYFFTEVPPSDEILAQVRGSSGLSLSSDCSEATTALF